MHTKMRVAQSTVKGLRIPPCQPLRPIDKCKRRPPLNYMRLSMTDPKAQARANLRARIDHALATGLFRTQEQLAEAVNISASHFSRLISKADSLNLLQQSRIAAALGCSVAELFQPLNPQSDAVPSGSDTIPSGPVQSVPLINPTVLESVKTDALDTIINSWVGKRMPVPQSEIQQFAVEQIDESMNRVAPQGAVLMVQPHADTWTPGAIYLIRFRGSVAARRASGEGDRRRYEADSMSGRYDPIYISDDPAPEVLGKVIGVYTRV